MRMTMEPKRWYSWDDTLKSGDRTVAVLDVASWRVRGEIVIGDVTHHVFREGRDERRFHHRGGRP
jgi:hypothetical protein